jgi:predicted short-subunit dehydrogenase-like oxidoreductase (DUF2520 family)
MSLLINMIGAGHLGQTIAHLLCKNPLVRIGAICNTSEASTSQAITFIGGGVYCPSIDELPLADITFITTPDDLIAEVCDRLSNNKQIKPKSTVLHCSGGLSSDVLLSLKEHHCYVASVHPMRSFANPTLSVNQYQGTYCAMEGDDDALCLLQDLFHSIGSITYLIDKTKKSLYHAAGVFASNYLVTLSQQALLCFKEAGVEEEMSMRIITTLMQSTVSNLASTLSPDTSLTGPIKRGDRSTVIKHVLSLESPMKELYSLIGDATIPLTTHDKATKELLKKALDCFQ